MKLTEFKDGDLVQIKGYNQIYVKFLTSNLPNDRFILLKNDNRNEPQLADINLICCDDWELVEPTYTTREAFKMMADGKEMISYQNECYKFNHLGDLILTRQKFEDYEHAILSKNELRGKWTEYKEEK